MSGLRSLAFAVWEFVVGEDWRLAAGAVAAIGGTALLAAYVLNAWWFAPAMIPVILGMSLCVAD